MEKDVDKIKEENTTQIDTEFAKPTTYDFDKNSFVVKPVFKEEANETLGTVLIRLMKSD